MGKLDAGVLDAALAFPTDMRLARKQAVVINATPNVLKLITLSGCITCVYHIAVDIGCCTGWNNRECKFIRFYCTSRREWCVLGKLPGDKALI